MIDNIDKVLSSELKEDLLSLREDVLDSHFDNLGLLKTYLWSKYIMGCDSPICLSDVDISGELDDFIVYLDIDYRVTYGYKPIQDLDSDILLKFRVNKEIIRDRKLEKIMPVSLK